MSYARLMPVRTAVFFALVFVLAGCASSYKSVSYDRIDYTGAQTTEGLDIAYRYEAQPGYYGEKTRKRGYDVVAVRVTNTRETPVTLNRSSLRLQAGGAPISSVRPDIVADNVKQPVWSYLLWNLANITVSDEDGFVAFIPLGLGISIINIALSSSANNRVEDAYREQYLMGTTVAPGETVEGLLFLSTTGFAPLTFEYVGGATATLGEPETVN